MGNETSSMKIHSLLTAEDLKGLRSEFPGGATSATPVTDLKWGAWKRAWPDNRREILEKLVKNGTDEVNFQAYQELAGRFVRGTTEERTKFIFNIMKNAQTIKASDLLAFIEDMTDILTRLMVPSINERQDAVSTLSQSLLHDLIFTGESRKSCLYKKPEVDPELAFDAIERWMVMSAPLFDRIMQHALAKSFGLSLEPSLIPESEIKLEDADTRLKPMEVVFLNSALPHDFRSQWRNLFNSRKHGESFAKLSAAVTNKGPNLIILWEEGSKNVLGGFAMASWKAGPKFFGSNQNFLFNLKPRAYVYEASSFNENYQYMNVKAKTMPNGIGMGGQLEYFGLWIDAEYGKARCAPSCSSYQSPQLSEKEYFHYDHLEVWAVGEEPETEDEDGVRKSALDLDPEAQAVMEMMGKTFVSKDVRAADEQNAKEKTKGEQNKN